MDSSVLKDIRKVTINIGNRKEVKVNLIKNRWREETKDWHWLTFSQNYLSHCSVIAQNSSFIEVSLLVAEQRVALERVAELGYEMGGSRGRTNKVIAGDWKALKNLEKKTVLEIIARESIATREFAMLVLSEAWLTNLTNVALFEENAAAQKNVDAQEKFVAEENVVAHDEGRGFKPASNSSKKCAGGTFTQAAADGQKRQRDDVNDATQHEESMRR